MSIREPAVAGMFYESSESKLILELENAFRGNDGSGSIPGAVKNGPGKIVGLVSPHAGFVYSGSTAASAYRRLAQDGLPDTVVIIGPNHRQYFPAVALTGDSEWRTPLGNIEVDMDATRYIADHFPQAEINSPAHRMEHSLEVQLPFLQYIANPIDAKIKIVPLLIGSIAFVSVDKDAELANDLGRVIAASVAGKRAVIIASTDFTHYKSADTAKKYDSQAIQQILNMDVKGLLQVVAELKISMCGAFPTAVMIAAAKHLGAEIAKPISYSNSGEITGDLSEVVGYASIELDCL